jgi:hypothetical protein
MAKRKRLGEVFARPRPRVHGRFEQGATGPPREIGNLGELLFRQGLESKKDWVAALGEVTTVPYVDCATIRVSADVLGTPAMARKCNLLPIRVGENELTVAQNIRVIDELQLKTDREIVPQLGFHAELRDTLERHYGPDSPGDVRLTRKRLLRSSRQSSRKSVASSENE